jgi:hypothetical protein
LLPHIGTRTRSWRVDRRFRETGRRPASAKGRGPQSRPDQWSEEQDVIVCGVCGAAITHRDQAIQINHRHDHAFFNPAGIAFAIRCFRLAPGVAPQGEPSSEFTWFPAYRWQIVLCRTCRAHLGWLFTHTDGNPAFHGLIADRLA